ncbi:MAG: DUF4157 domain-containing protein [Actinobacteria bacterium]|nr:DUF4157 domain-containing protein [Actinomycetota bacterium]
MHAVLSGAGQPLPPAVRSAMGARFGHDFSGVRVHTGGAAASAAAAVDAVAFTVGRDIVFGAGRYAPRTPLGEGLLSHELAHVVQQDSASNGRAPAGFDARDASGALEVSRPGEAAERQADDAARSAMAGEWPAAMGRLAGPRLQRLSVGEWLARFFGFGTFDEDELRRYLRGLHRRRGPEKDFDSDNKARAVVDAWKTGSSPYVLTPATITYLIEEMLLGFTANPDEQAILELLERSPSHALRYVLTRIPPRRLEGAIHWAEQDRLDDFYRRRFRGGKAAVLAGRIEPIGAPVPLGTELTEARRTTDPTEATHPGEEVPEPACSVDNPAACHAYEDWVELFADLPTFPSRSGAQVIGPAAAPEATATDPKAPPGERRPKLAHGPRDYLETDRFIDGPTDAWVRANLPADLVEVAYQLPSDCADMAVILRHVWLVAHRRTELYHGWVCGAALAETRSREVQDLIRNQVYSGNVSRVVRPYTGPDGQPIRSFEALQPLLHPGDVLVWNHNDPDRHRGHTQTVTALTRDEQGRITSITVLQGNQPIGRAAAEQFRREDPSAPSVATLRAAPGRRIEVSGLSGQSLRDVNDIWTWSNGRTTLVAAGPPAVATQPEVRRGRQGQDVVRGLEDWHARLRGAATIAELQSRIEAALLEARALIEGGHPRSLTEAEAKAFGRVAGEAMWSLAREAARAGLGREPRADRPRTLTAEELGATSHYRPLRHVRGLIARLAEGAGTHAQTVRARFRVLGDAFERGARGLTTADFGRTGQPADVEFAHVLVTGFDPFRFEHGRQVAPQPGDWNPAGAAVLQLDGTTQQVQPRLRAAVEGAIFPVRFADFRQGVVESLVRPVLPTVDGVITVSMDPGIRPEERPEIERYAVGIHRLNNGVHESVPPTPVDVPAPPAQPSLDDPRGAAVYEARGDLERIASEAGAALGGEPLPVDATARLDFGVPEEADRFLRAIGRGPEGRSAVDVDLTTVSARIDEVERDVQGPGIVLRIGDDAFQAAIRRGPGGSFLSNEVFFRVLRAVALHEAGGGATRDPAAFHVHTPRGTAAEGARIPQPVGTPAEREQRHAAIATGRGVLQRLLRVLRAMIATVARRARDRRRSAAEDAPEEGGE